MNSSNAVAFGTLPEHSASPAGSDSQEAVFPAGQAAGSDQNQKTFGNNALYESGEIEFLSWSNYSLF